MDIYFTRHGRTEWNKALRFQGGSGDSPLLPNSLKEIALLGEHVKDIPFQKIYTSPLLRAKRTAEIINSKLAHPVEIIEAPELKEMGLGDLEGKYINEMEKIYPEELQALRRQPDKYDPSAFHGETFEEVIARLSDFVVAKINETKDDAPILFVSHGAALTAAIHAMAGEELKDVRRLGGLNNNSLTMMETTTKQLPFTLKVYNDASFLKGVQAHASGDELI